MMNRNSTATSAVARRRARDGATVSTLSGNPRVSELVRQATGFKIPEPRNDVQRLVNGHNGKKERLVPVLSVIF